MAKNYLRSTTRKLFNDGTGFRASYPKTTPSATLTPIASPHATKDSPVLINVRCTETFATGSGAKPTFKIGQTGTIEKFITAAQIAALTIGQEITVAGQLTHADDLLITTTVATGTGAGAIRVMIQAFPVTI